MNSYAVNNPLWKDKYQTHILPLDFGQSLENIGKITVGKLLRMVLFTFHLLFVLISYRPTLVYFTIMPTGKIFYRDAFFTWLLKLIRRTVIFHLHGKGIQETIQGSNFKKWLYRKTFNNVAVICLSPSLTKDISEIYTEKPFILGNCVSPNDIKPLDKQDSAPIILFLSNLIKAKGIETFLSSVVLLKKQRPEFRVRVVGGEFDFSFEEAREFCRLNKIDDVVDICGPMFGSDKQKELSMASLLVLPSKNECLPLVILEAMQAALPVIASNVGGIPDIIRPMKNGLLIDPNNSHDLSEKIKLLLDDIELRTKLGKQAKKDFEEFYTLETFHVQLSAIFDQVLQSKNK